jgi:hypothetical protein
MIDFDLTLYMVKGKGQAVISDVLYFEKTILSSLNCPGQLMKNQLIK